MTVPNDTDPDATPVTSPLPFRVSSVERLTFPSHFRIRSGRDFERIYEIKQKASDPILLIFGGTNGLPHSRIGLSVSRRHGNSVARHRLRRLLKEAFRLEQHHLPSGLDLILIPGRESRHATQEMFRESLVQLSRRLAKRLSK
ncbi:MAG TPA: ribonuclease P protein component [Planctomicrobium sp.]|nr:ribonuclease P protein component [Planctomicrobium sp.]